MAVSNRTFKSTSQSAQHHTLASERPPEYKKSYNEDKLQLAYEEVVGGHLSVRVAAEKYDVPKSTLSDRVTGRVKFDARSGPSRYLTDKEEEELVGFISLCAMPRRGRKY